MDNTSLAGLVSNKLSIHDERARKVSGLQRSKASKSNTLYQLLRTLPRELRGKIFEHLLYDPKGVNITECIGHKDSGGRVRDRDNPRDLSQPPSFCHERIFQLEEFREEAYFATLRCKPMGISNGHALHWFRTWLSSLGPNGSASVRILYFHNLWKYALNGWKENSYVSLAMNCPGLAEFRFNVFIGFRDRFKPMTKLQTQAFVEKLGLEPLFHHAKLQRISIFFSWVEDYYFSFWDDEKPSDSFPPFAQVLKKRLQRCITGGGREIVVEVTGHRKPSETTVNWEASPSFPLE